VFDIGHQAVDKADMLDVLPATISRAGCSQRLAYFSRKKRSASEIRSADRIPASDDLVFGVKGQLVDQEQITPDGKDERTISGVSLISQMDMRGGAVLSDRAPETVADQIETALGAHQVKAGVQIEKLFDDAHGDPVKVFYGLVFLARS